MHRHVITSGCDAMSRRHETWIEQLRHTLNDTVLYRLRPE